MSKLRIRQVRSGLGAAPKIRRTLTALGLKHQRTVIKPDNPAVRGMLFKVKHLVEVVPEPKDAEQGSRDK